MRMIRFVNATMRVRENSKKLSNFINSKGDTEIPLKSISIGVLVTSTRKVFPNPFSVTDHYFLLNFDQTGST